MAICTAFFFRFLTFLAERVENISLQKKSDKVWSWGEVAQLICVCVGVYESSTDQTMGKSLV